MTKEEIAQQAKAYHDFTANNPEAVRLSPIEIIERYPNGTEILEWKKSAEAASTMSGDNKPERQENIPQSPSHSLGHLPIGFLSLFSQINHEILEDDPLYQKLEKLQKEKWSKDHPNDKDFSTQEEIDYTYGSDNPSASFLHKETLNKIKEYSNQYNLYEQNKDNKEYKQYKQYKKYNKLLIKYEEKESKFKPKKNPLQDPYVARTERLIREETEARLQLLSKNNPALTKKELEIKKAELEAQIKTKKWDEFTSNHSNRTKAYAEKHEEIGKAYKAIEAQKQTISENEVSHPTILPPIPDPNIPPEEISEKIPETSPNTVSSPALYSNQTPVERPDDSQRSIPPQPPIAQPTHPLHDENREYEEQRNHELFERLQSGHAPQGNYSPHQQSDSQSRRPSFNNIRQGFNRVFRHEGRKGVERQAEKQAVKKGIEKIGEQLGKQFVKQAAQKAMVWLLSLMGTQAIVLILILGFTFFLVGFGGGFNMESGSTGGTPGGVTPSPSPTTSSLNYIIPFRDFSVLVPDGTKERIKNEFPLAKVNENFDVIVRESKNNKWNPMFVLALWMEESGAQSASSYSDALGCAPGQPTTDINISLKCLFNNFPISRYSDEKFADFMCVYGGDGFHTAPCVFNVENPDFPKNIKKFYSLLVPSGKGALQTINTSTASDCPVPNGKITTYSFDKDPQNGHCAPNYGSCANEYPFCPTNGRRAKSIDMIGENGNKNIYLPTISGEKVIWEYIQRFSVNQSEGGGSGYVFKAQKGSDHWYLQLLHMGETSLSPNTQYPSNTFIGPYYTDHVHITTGKNIKNPLSSGTQNTNCDEGWMPAENICGSK